MERNERRPKSIQVYCVLELDENSVGKPFISRLTGKFYTLLIKISTSISVNFKKLIYINAELLKIKNNHGGLEEEKQSWRPIIQYQILKDIGTVDIDIINKFIIG